MMPGKSDPYSSAGGPDAERRPGHDQLPAMDQRPFQPHATGLGRAPWVQRCLAALVLVLVLAGVFSLLAGVLRYGIVSFIAAAGFLMVFAGGAGRERAMFKTWRIRSKKQPDKQVIDPFQSDPATSHPPEANSAGSGRPDGAPPWSESPRHLGPGGRLPEPPTFGTSTAGRAPWHVPVSPAVAGLAADAALMGDLEIRAASMVGAGHRCENPADPRQDAYALGSTLDGQYLIIAVADGVSASRYADLGARVAVSTAVRELARMLGSGGIPAINTEMLYKMIAGEMAGTARSRRLTEQDVCSVLVTAVIPTAPARDGTRTMWSSWIGDVSLWIQRDSRLYRLTGEEKSGLDPNALGAVLPFQPDLVQETTRDLAQADRVVVMTDGLSDSMRAVSGVTEFFQQQWAGPPPHPALFLHSLCYDGPGQTDDRTVVVVWCGDEAAARSDAYAGPPT